MITCTKKYIDFPFGHKQPSHKGHCRFIHGHGWDIEYTFAADARDECGFVVDFGRLKPLKERLDEMFDHTFLINADDPDRAALEALDKVVGQSKMIDLRIVEDCTCEGIAKLAHDIAADYLAGSHGGRVRVASVTVWEDSKNSATYTGGEGTGKL